MDLDNAETQAESSEAQAPAEPSSEAAPAAAERPNWLPEKFWDAEAGQARFEDLAGAYSQIEQRFMTKRDDLINEFKDEWLSEGREGVPEAADGYEVSLPDDLVPEGMEVSLENGDPLLDFWRQHCFDNKLSNETFNAGIETFLRNEIGNLPTADSVRQALGDNAKDRVQSAMQFLSANVSAATYDAIAQMPIMPPIVEAIEQISKSINGGIPSQTTGAPVNNNVPSLEELRELQASPAYLKGDRATVEKVRQGYQARAAMQRRA